MYQEYQYQYIQCKGRGQQLVRVSDSVASIKGSRVDSQICDLLEPYICMHLYTHAPFIYE